MKLYLVELIDVDDGSSKLFGVYESKKLAKIDLQKLSDNIDQQLFENVDYEISEIELNKTNYL